MATVIFITSDGQTVKAQDAPGKSLMRVAVDHDVPGIPGECGGVATCGTCHVQVDTPWLDHLPAISDDEQALLEFVHDRQATSRLACQLVLSDRLDGIVLHVPAQQI